MQIHGRARNPVTETLTHAYVISHHMHPPKLQIGQRGLEISAGNFFIFKILKLKMLNFDWLLSSGFCFKKRAWPAIQARNRVQIDISSLNCAHFYKLGVFRGGSNFIFSAAPKIFFMRPNS